MALQLCWILKHALKHIIITNDIVCSKCASYRSRSTHMGSGPRNETRRYIATIISFPDPTLCERSSVFLESELLQRGSGTLYVYNVHV